MTKQFKKRRKCPAGHTHYTFRNTDPCKKCSQPKDINTINIININQKNFTTEEKMIVDPLDGVPTIEEALSVISPVVKEKIAEKSKAYREANKEAIAEKKKAYYEANKEAIAEKNKAYYEANKEAIAEKNKAYYEANKEELQEKKEPGITRGYIG